MIKSGKIDQERLDQLWKDFTGKEPGATGATPIARRAMEQGRVRYWNYILELAHTYRKKLKESYSDYYEAKGNSVETDIGKKYAKELNDVISNAAAQNPRFARDIEMYFSNSTNVGGHLIDWYAY